MNSIPWRLNAGSFISLNKVSNIACSCSYFVCGCYILNATYSCVGIYIVCLQKVCMVKERNIFSRLVRWFEKLLYDLFFSALCLSNCASIDAICVSVRVFGCGVQFFISSSYIYFTRSFDAFMIFFGTHSPKKCKINTNIEIVFEFISRKAFVWSPTTLCRSVLSKHLFFDGFYSLSEFNFFPFANSLSFFWCSFYINVVEFLLSFWYIYLLYFHDEYDKAEWKWIA